MRCIPLVEGRAQALAQLVDEALGNQGHGHLARTDVKVQGAGAFPAQVLIEAEELLDVPALWEVGAQGSDLAARASAGEALEVKLLGAFAGALNVTVARIGQGAAPWMEGFGGNREASPLLEEKLR